MIYNRKRTIAQQNNRLDYAKFKRMFSASKRCHILGSCLERSRAVLTFTYLLNVDLMENLDPRSQKLSILNQKVIFSPMLFWFKSIPPVGFLSPER